MTQLIHRMNAVFSEWKARHFIQASLAHSEFTLTENGFLQFHDLVICDAGNLELESACFDTEEIVFFLSNARSIILTIAWPLDEEPFVSELHFYCGFSS